MCECVHVQYEMYWKYLCAHQCILSHVLCECVQSFFHDVKIQPPDVLLWVKTKISFIKLVTYAVSNEVLLLYECHCLICVPS